MSNLYYEGCIDAEFNGFDENAIFKMNNGTYWLQEEYRYWYHYEYRPNATITEENGRYILNVAGESVTVSRLDSVIESRIDGKFDGWGKGKKYRLVNGQTWEQSRYKYEYKYAYRPEVLICRIGGSYVMYVEGTHAEVRRV